MQGTYIQYIKLLIVLVNNGRRNADVHAANGLESPLDSHASLVPRPRPAFHRSFFVHVQGEPGNEATTMSYSYTMYMCTL